MSKLELKIPPPVVGLLMCGLMWLIARQTPTLKINVTVGFPIAGLVATLGFVAALLGAIALARARTTINPMKPESASSIVQGGIFKITRNPMYLGILLAMTGWGLYLANPIALLFVPAFILYMNRFQIGPEERRLTERFKDEYVAYKARVRRWI